MEFLFSVFFSHQHYGIILLFFRTTTDCLYFHTFLSLHHVLLSTYNILFLCHSFFSEFLFSFHLEAKKCNFVVAFSFLSKIFKWLKIKIIQKDMSLFFLGDGHWLTWLTIFDFQTNFAEKRTANHIWTLAYRHLLFSFSPAHRVANEVLYKLLKYHRWASLVRLRYVPFLFQNLLFNKYCHQIWVFSMFHMIFYLNQFI